MLRSSLFWLGATGLLLRRRPHLVMQAGRTDCGVACTLTVLNLLGRPGDPVDAVEHMDADRAGTDLDSMRRYFADRLGCPARALAVPADRLKQVPGHLILHMRQKHYVVLLKRGRDGVLVFDPAVGPVYYPMADFTKLYSGHLLAVSRPPRGGMLPVPASGLVVGGTHRRGLSQLSLFVIGLAARLLECAILLCLVAALFLVLNRASAPSILMMFGLIAVCGGVLLVARQTRAEGEAGLTRLRQIKLWRGLLRTSLGGQDLNGFRGRPERDVAANLRRGMVVAIPQRAQIPGALGSILGLSLLLCVLSPWVALAHMALFAVLLVLMQIDDVQVCRLSVRPGIGRYSKLGLGHSMLNATVAPDMFGEIAKWTVIGFAGASVLLADLPPVALMFWILTAMQVVPIDFRRAQTVAPILGVRQAVSGLTASQVPLRRQSVGGPVDLKLSHAAGRMQIDGLQPLTATLQQPDLTTREQRLILGDVVRHTLASLPEDHRPAVGPVRIFAPGQDATQADFEHLMIAREGASGSAVPALRDTRKTLELGAQDAVLRDLHSCAPGDFPVFWDFRGRIAVDELQARMSDAGIRRAGHLTMKRLTLVEAA